MRSSADRRRIEIPAYLFERVKQIADAEQRTMASVVHEILMPGVWNYRPQWTPADRDRLGARARRVLELAENDEPSRFNHDYVGTEHLLLAILAEGSGVGAKVLGGLGVGHDAVSRQLEAVVGRGAEPPRNPRDLVPRLRKVLGMSLNAASEPELFTGGRVGTGHLLLAIVREGEGIAAAILKRLGVELDRVAEAVTAALSSADQPMHDS
jgi:ATP-dependent Clp protease ATP-binding subunit ClpC